MESLLCDLRETNESLFSALPVLNAEAILPLVYAPTVG
jgi:hypothetical protein